MSRELTRVQSIERSIIRKYRKELWAPFLNAISEYKLIQPNDRIAVCISGGKDSMCMAKLFQELKRHSDIPFELRFIVMNPGYEEEDLDKFFKYAKMGAENGNVECEYLYGRELVIRSDLYSDDYNEGLFYLKKAAKKGHKESIRFLTDSE